MLPGYYEAGSAFTSTRRQCLCSGYFWFICVQWEEVTMSQPSLLAPPNPCVKADVLAGGAFLSSDLGSIVSLSYSQIDHIWQKLERSANSMFQNEKERDLTYKHPFIFMRFRGNFPAAICQHDNTPHRIHSLTVIVIIKSVKLRRTWLTLSTD